MSQEKTAVGVSLGSECCVVAVTTTNGRHEIVASAASGGRSTPAYLSFVGGEILMGDGAKHSSVRQPTHSVPSLLPLVSAEIVTAGTLRPKCEVEVRSVDGKDCVVFPTADGEGLLPISPSSPLKNDTVEEGGAIPHTATELLTTFLGLVKVDTIDGAVANRNVGCMCVAIPRYMSSYAATIRECCEQTGIAKDVRIVYDDVAGIMAYNKKTAAAQNPGSTSGPMDGGAFGSPQKTGDVLVVDWGANTLSISVIRAHGGVFSLYGHHHKFNSGATLLDKQLAKMVCTQFQRKSKIDATENGRAMRKLMQALEDVRKTLSVAPVASVDIEAFCEGVDLKDPLTRVKLEACIREVGLADAMDEVLAKAVENAMKCAAEHGESICINEVVLMGGFCRTPKIKSTVQIAVMRLAQELGVGPADVATIEFSDPQSADEAAAMGACMEAYLTTESHPLIEDDRQRKTILGDMTGETAAKSLAGRPVVERKYRAVDAPADPEEVDCAAVKTSVCLFTGAKSFMSAAVKISDSEATTIIAAEKNSQRSAEIKAGIAAGAVFVVDAEAVATIAPEGSLLPFRSGEIAVRKDAAVLPLVLLSEALSGKAVVAALFPRAVTPEENTNVCFKLSSENNGGTFTIEATARDKASQITELGTATW